MQFPSISYAIIVLFFSASFDPIYTANQKKKSVIHPHVIQQEYQHVKSSTTEQIESSKHVYTWNQTLCAIPSSMQVIHNIGIMHLICSLTQELETERIIITSRNGISNREMNL